MRFASMVRATPARACASTATRCCSIRTASASHGRLAAVATRLAAPGDNAATALKSVVVDTGSYDWEGDTAPCRPFAKTVIYEMHVAGFTRNPNSGVAPRQARHLCGA